MDERPLQHARPGPLIRCAFASAGSGRCRLLPVACRVGVLLDEVPVLLAPHQLKMAFLFAGERERCGDRRVGGLRPAFATVGCELSFGVAEVADGRESVDRLAAQS